MTYFCMRCELFFETKEAWMQHEMHNHPPGKQRIIADNVSDELRNLLNELDSLSDREREIIEQIGMYFKAKKAGL